MRAPGRSADHPEAAPGARPGLAALRVGAVAAVAFAAACFAHFFREAIFAVAELVADHHSAVDAAKSTNRLLVFALVATGLVLATVIGRIAARWHHERLGLAAIAAAARGEGPGPSIRGTALRSSGTLVASSSFASIGRESAILEMGGSIGSFGDRVVRRSTPLLATTGITAAFAAAYHAPLASVMYVEEHIGVRHDRRTALHAVAGALLGWASAKWVLDSHAVLPHSVDPWSWRVAVVALVALFPAYAASRAFWMIRERMSRRPGFVAAWWWTGALAVVGGVMVATVPLTAGNGLEAIRTAATSTTFGIGLALLAGKLVATTAAVGSGAPGGVVSPSLAVAGGAALLCAVALRGAGMDLGTAGWDAMLIVMTVGVAVSVKAPLMAVFMVPEMAGDMRLVPVSALTVLAAWLIECGVCRRRVARAIVFPRARVPVEDVDA